MIRLMFAPYKVSAEMKKLYKRTQANSTLWNACRQWSCIIENWGANWRDIKYAECREHCVDELNGNGTKATFSVCCLTVQMRRKYPKGSSLIHSVFYFFFFRSLRVCAIVNFTFSTHLFSGRLLFLSGGRILYDFICIWMRLCRWY